MSTRDFTQLLTAFTEHLSRHPPRSLTPRSHVDSRFGARTMSPGDRLLITVITRRWSTHGSALTSILGLDATTITRAIHETTLDLTHLGRTIPPAPIKATTTDALPTLIGKNQTSKDH